MTAEPIRHLAVPASDHNLHVNLLQVARAMGEDAPEWVVVDERSPSGRPGLRPHNRLLRLSQLLRHY
jgi:hypothetical protein